MSTLTAVKQCNHLRCASSSVHVHNTTFYNADKVRYLGTTRIEVLEELGRLAADGKVLSAVDMHTVLHGSEACTMQKRDKSGSQEVKVGCPRRDKRSACGQRSAVRMRWAPLHTAER